jgi:hypothetical protein
MPLLELLIHYREIDYKGKKYYNCYWSRIDFGNNTVDLDPVDIKSLSLFQVDPGHLYRNSLTCAFHVASKKVVSALKGELARLRKLDDFNIQFFAPDKSDADGDDSNHRVWVNNWFLRGVLIAIGLYGLSKLNAAWAHAKVQVAQASYDTALNTYNVCLQECLSTIPEHVQAVAGYLATNDTPVHLSLPSGLKMPPFRGCPGCITLSAIEMATQAADTLNQVESPRYPFFGFWSFTAVIPTCLFGAVHLIKSIALKFFKIRLDFPIITACKIAIIKSAPETNAGESAPL